MASQGGGHRAPWPNAPGDERPLNPAESQIVADEVILRTPTQDEVRRLLETLNEETGKWDYKRIGMDLDILKKTCHLRLKLFQNACGLWATTYGYKNSLDLWVYMDGFFINSRSA